MPKKPFTKEQRARINSIDDSFFVSKISVPRTIKREARMDLFRDLTEGSDRFISDEMRKNPKWLLYSRLREKAEARDFQRQRELLRTTIKTTERQRKIALDKAKLILENKQNVIRLDNLARMLTEIGVGNAFSYNEVARGQKGVLSLVLSSSPRSLIRYFRSKFVNKVADWGGLAKYSAIAYFDPQIFESIGIKRLGYEWGQIRKDIKSPVLAVQVMHWDPKVLAGFTKGMLKIIPDNPIAVFDLYGNLFFP